MLTVTSKKYLSRAVKARLCISSVRASILVEENIFELDDIKSPLKDCVVTINNKRNGLSIWVPEDGILTFVGNIGVEESDLETWAMLPLEEAYSLPEGVKFAEQMKVSFVDGEIFSADPIDDNSIAVVVKIERENADPIMRDMVMLTEISDSADLLEYAREMVGKKGRMCIEENPTGKRAEDSGDGPILEMIITGN